MPNQSETLKYLGPLVSQPYVAYLCDFDERIWEVYREHAKRHGPITHGSRDYLIIRLMYIAEVTSNAIRLNSTWSLTPAAMSLLRDRYEQTVRFSWLVRNPDQEEYAKYERAIFGKINSLVRNLSLETLQHFEEQMGPVASWATEALSKEQKAYFGAWNTLDLKSMAAKRDLFPPIDDGPLAQEKLAHWYDPIYAQFSSVSHYDRFSIEMVRPETNDDGSVNLRLLPHWPNLLILQTGLLDMIQCYEGTTVCFGQRTSIKFESLFLEWRSLGSRLKVD